ncbi:MAG: type 1 glutamine amidotransferase [Gallionella sp.]
MKPIAIFRHVAVEGPGYLGEFLTARNIPWQLIAIDAHDPMPGTASAFSGLVFMGGPMSVNDELPWIPQSLALIREAVALDIPVLGHCLGGQLIAKALGGLVTRNPCKEIGWWPVAVADNDTARVWFGDATTFTAYHWHGETFSLPTDAVPILSSPACASQGFVLGKHLALQCHVEMTADMVQDWCRVGAEEVGSAKESYYVQSVIEMNELSERYIPDSQKIAAVLYTKWLAGALNSAPPRVMTSL